MPTLPGSPTKVGLLLLATLALVVACGSVSAPRTAAVARGPSPGAPTPSAVPAAPTAAPATPSAAIQPSHQPRALASPQDMTPGIRHFTYVPDPEDVCRQNLAFGNDAPESAPGTPRMQYDFTGTVDGVRYELDWQLVPWHGAGTYRFTTDERTLTTWLYLMSLPDHTVYLAPGGTVTVAPDGRSGTMHTRLVVADGRPVDISGPWSCGDAR